MLFAPEFDFGKVVIGAECIGIGAAENDPLVPELAERFPGRHQPNVVQHLVPNVEEQVEHRSSAPPTYRSTFIHRRSASPDQGNEPLFGSR